MKLSMPHIFLSSILLSCFHQSEAAPGLRASIQGRATEEVDMPDNSLPTDGQPSLPIESQCLPPSSNDKCHTEESYNDCLFFEKIGCTKILSTSSCPPLFYCGHPVDGPMLPIESPCIPPSWNGDECHTEKSYNECLKLLGKGCPNSAIAATSSCHPQYFCSTPKPTQEPTPEPTTPKPSAEPTTSSPTPASTTPEPTTAKPTPVPTTPQPTDKPTDPPVIENPIEIESMCAPPDGECQTEESYLECAVLEAQNCSTIISTFSCPPQYSCADTQCVLPTEEGKNCESAESYNQCIGLEEMGCDQVIHSMSCPPTYACAKWGPQRSQCALPDECQTEQSYLQCKALEKAGCQSIRSSWDSCPPVHQCSHYWPMPNATTTTLTRS